MKILFCTDGSKISYNAIKNFSQLFENIDADIICVSDMTYMPDSVMMSADKYIQNCSASINNILDYSQDYLKNLDINVNSTIKKCGNAVDYILETENNGNYDYTVMGSNGKKGLQKWLGSVSQEVAANSKGSVYISKTLQEKKNILFPITSDDCLTNELKNVINQMNLTKAKINLLNVYEIPEFLFLEGNIDSNWVSDVEIKQQKEADKILNSVEMILVNKGISVTEKAVIKGNSSEEILKFINSRSISHVVLSTKKHKTFSVFGFSSISRRVLENAPCDVIINK